MDVIPLGNSPAYELLPDENMVPRSESRPRDALAIKVASVCIILFNFAAWMPIVIKGPSVFGWFSPHPLFQSIALSLFTYGVITLQRTSKSQPSAKVAGLARHQLAMLATGIPLLFLGASSVWYNKVIHGKQHFTTWHGKMGLLCMIWLAFQALVGGGSVWFGGAAFGGGMKAKALWKYHRLSGYVLFPLLFFTAHLGGFWSAWSINNASTFVRFTAFTVSPLFIVVAVFARIRISKIPLWGMQTR